MFFEQMPAGRRRSYLRAESIWCFELDTGETSEIEVIGDDVAAMLDRECGEVSVVDQIACRPEGLQQLTDQIEVASRRFDHDRRLLSQPVLDLFDRLAGRQRRGEQPATGCQPYEGQ